VAPSKAVEIARSGDQHTSARIVPARLDGQKGIAVLFEGTDDIHYYARPEAAPAPGFELTVKATSEKFDFDRAVFPKWTIYQDPLGTKVEVYKRRFTVFVPIKSVKAPEINQADVEVEISAAVCTSIKCLTPSPKTLRTTVDYSQSDSWKTISLEAAGGPDVMPAGPAYTVWFALALALLAGLSLNIMPCVWPILPLIVMRIVEQAKHGRAKSMAMGFAFCLGILLFFAGWAGLNIGLQVFYGRVLQWGDQFRNPAFVAAMALFLVALALFMFGVFTITIPSSIASKSGSGKGYPGAVGMGLLAAVLSTPCSFGILGAVFFWAQGQSLAMGTLVIMVVGVGMAIPYAILTSMPGLLKGLPKSGRWMELFKQAVGFLLLLIAVKLMTALPQTQLKSVLYFAVVVSFCLWMWAAWVSYSSPLSRKIVVRAVAVVLAVLAWRFLFAPQLITWQDYDPDLIKNARAENRPVLIKFTADWCASCAVVDKAVYQKKDIAKLIKQKGVLPIKADTTQENHPATLDLKNVYKEPGIPVTVLFLPQKEQDQRFHDLFFAKELKKLLEELPAQSRHEQEGKKQKARSR
jgi:thiol:disulfide interchange protein DsbD